MRGCVDVDFNFSPSTNLLPIRRGAIGRRRRGLAALPVIRVQPLEQTYERLGENLYRYASATGFTADIEVNGEGLPAAAIRKALRARERCKIRPSSFPTSSYGEREAGEIPARPPPL